MPRITKLTAQRNPNFVNVFVDGRFETSLDLATVTRLGLKVGTDIAGTTLITLKKESQFEKLYNRALHFLSFRPRSEKELRDHFQRNVKTGQDISERNKAISRLIDKLKKKGFLNDHEFATWWVDQRQTFRNKSKRAITYELRQKGIDAKIISEALSQIDDTETARRIAQKKIRSMRNKSWVQARWKLGEFLKRHGFLWETIRAVVDELLPQE